MLKLLSVLYLNKLIYKKFLQIKIEIKSDEIYAHMTFEFSIVGLSNVRQLQRLSSLGCTVCPMFILFLCFLFEEKGHLFGRGKILERGEKS